MTVSRKILLVLGLFLLVRIAYFVFSTNTTSSGGDGQISLTVVLENVPRNTPKSQQFEAEKYKIVARKYPELDYGDRLKITGEAKNGVIIYPQVQILKKNEGNWGLMKIYQLRASLVSVLEKVLPEPEGGLAAGILLGYKAGLDSKLSLNLRNVGLTHVVAASGANLTLFSGLITTVGQFLFNRRLVVLFSIPLIWFYAVLCGFEAPVIRAAIMASFSYAAILLGRQVSGFWGLALAGYLMILADPGIVFNLGFQLSVAAMVGILGIGKIRDVRGVGVVWETMRQTLAAQIMTLPIILANFGLFNIFSFITNALVLWTVPYVMAISGLAGIVGLGSEGVAKMVIIPGYFLLSYFVGVANFFGGLTFGLLQGERLNVVSSAGIYICLIGLIWLIV